MKKSFLYSIFRSSRACRCDANFCTTFFRLQDLHLQSCVAIKGAMCIPTV